ncbi:hypothetical protein [Nocardia brasiliensis]|uniref:hypothetical protein n=1 Tax=Nocardia brasiliensis TaxID=37326 RepID=UPI003D8F9F95
MGRHRAPRKSEVTMQFAVVSTAAVLTALVCTHRDGPPAGRSATSQDHATSGLSGRPLVPPPVSGPEAVPEPPIYEAPTAPVEPPVSPWTPPAPAPQAAEPEAPAPRDVVGGMTAAWVSGTQQGYDCLTRIEQHIAAHVRSVVDQRPV